MKILKKLARLTLVLALSFACFSALGVSASAEEKITYRIEYDGGTAYLYASPSNGANYLTYTTNGTAPNSKGRRMPLFVAVTEQTAFSISEYTEAGKRVSGIKLTVSPKVADVVVTTTAGNGETKVKLTCATEGAKIYYTVDESTPTENSTLYTDELTFKRQTRIRVVAYKKGCKRSAIISRNIYVSDKTSETVKSPAKNDDDEPAAAASAGSSSGERDATGVKIRDTSKMRYNITQDADKQCAYVTITPQKASHKIYYTTDGSAPSKKSKLYKSRVKFTEIGTFRAVEYTAKGELVCSLKVSVPLKCAPVEFVCRDISVGTKIIELTTKTPDAKIYYTINGSIPDPATAPLYTGPLTLGDTTTLTAVAVKNGYKKGSVKSVLVRNVAYRMLDIDYSDPLYQEVADVVNAERKKNGLSPLRLNNTLTEAANIRAKELIVVNDHYRPSGVYYTSVFVECKIDVKMNAEFIATYQKTPQDLVSYLLKQKENQILVDKGYKYNSIGVGFCTYGSSRYWCVIVAEL